MGIYVNSLKQQISDVIMLQNYYAAAVNHEEGCSE